MLQVSAWRTYTDVITDMDLESRWTFYHQGGLSAKWIIYKMSRASASAPSVQLLKTHLSLCLLSSPKWTDVSCRNRGWQDLICARLRQCVCQLCLAWQPERGWPEVSSELRWKGLGHISRWSLKRLMFNAQWDSETKRKMLQNGFNKQQQQSYVVQVQHDLVLIILCVAVPSSFIDCVTFSLVRLN